MQSSWQPKPGDRVFRPRRIKRFRLRRVLGVWAVFSAVLGFVSLAVIWVIILITQPYSRWVGLAWMLGGLAIYYFYHRREWPSRNNSPKKITTEING